MNHETKVGLFLLGTLAVILPSILFIGNFKLFRRTSTYFIDFKDVEALPPKAAVKVAGVEIGKVANIKLLEGQARVQIEIDPNLDVHEDASAKVGSTGVIGTRFIELSLGSVHSPVLDRGSVIRGLDGGGLEGMIQKLSGLFEEDKEYGDAIDNLKATLANIRNVSDSLNNALGEKKRELEDIVFNVRALTENARVFTADLRNILEDKKDDVKIALGKIKNISEKLDRIVDRIEKGEGTIGALVSDDQTAKEVKQAIASIKDTAASAKNVFRRFADIDTYWDYQYRYDGTDDEGRSDVGIKIVPREGKYYYFGASNIGEPIDDEKHQAFERKNRINALLGQDFGPFTGYAGAIRSRGGVGVKLRPFWFNEKWNRKAELEVEASDFSRDRVVKGVHLDRTWVATGARVSIKRWLWIGARVEDILERSVFMTNLNIVFKDEDLAYLLGLAGAAR